MTFSGGQHDAPRNVRLIWRLRLRASCRGLFCDRSGAATNSHPILAAPGTPRRAIACSPLHAAGARKNAVRRNRHAAPPAILIAPRISTGEHAIALAHHDTATAKRMADVRLVKQIGNPTPAGQRALRVEGDVDVPSVVVPRGDVSIGDGAFNRVKHAGFRAGRQAVRLKLDAQRSHAELLPPDNGRRSVAGNATRRQPPKSKKTTIRDAAPVHSNGELRSSGTAVT
jgi:hypothetical protein